MNDPITDMFNRIRNVHVLQKKVVDIPCSNLKLGIVEILKEKGLVGDFKKRGKKPHQIIRIVLKYKDGAPCIEGFKRVSKPGQRIYKKSKEIKIIKNGYGLAIVSTHKGLLSDERARKERLGGEVIVEVW